MVAIFKRSVNVGGVVGSRMGGPQAQQDLELLADLRELVDCFTVLVDVTGFLEVLHGSSLLSFPSHRKSCDDPLDFLLSKC